MSIRDDQRAYYERLLREHGDDPRTLGHRDGVTRDERFTRLARVFAGAPPSYTVHEVGCGLGDFGSYLAAQHPGARYSGSDIVESFVERCRRRFPDNEFDQRDLTCEPAATRYDYLTLSGTFNGRLGSVEEEFRSFISTMLRSMYAACRIGIAYNFLNAHADWHDDTLHYESIGDAAAFAQTELSRHVELDASGPLFEFTVRVWRPEAIAACYPDAEFGRYFAPDQDERAR